MRNKNIWLFNAGNAFAGNPKWLFLYMQEHHPEVDCYWLCFKQELVDKMHAMGFKAYLYRSREARAIGRRAGVYVVEQNKEKYHVWLDGITVLNLWHGVTCKKLEHAVTEGYMEEGIAAKHIRNESVYRQQLMLVTSPDQERVFREQCKIPESNIIRAPYPNCFEKVQFASFDHDFKDSCGAAPETKVALYAPTFRDFDRSAFFSRAIPDMEALLSTAADNGWMLVVKVHPQMEQDFQFKALKHRYADDPRVLFWDNANDFYEVMDQVDMAIVDYSSIFFDLMAHGVKRFVRYAFDYGNKDKLRDFAFDYLDVTCGTLCTTFDELLAQFATDEPTDAAEIQRVYDWAWAYGKDHTVGDIVQRAMTHKVDRFAQLPVLCSFDVFDTLIGRTTGSPDGVFAYVNERMRTSELTFPGALTSDYTRARKEAEENCRQLMSRTLAERDDNRTEITFDMIFERLRDLYNLTDNQVEFLKGWELEAERAVSVPITNNIEKVRHLVAAGTDVLLLSDMYLPEDFVRELLVKADPILGELPLFLSSTTGRQKTKKGLYLDAFHGVPDYHYSRWMHMGDSKRADVEMANELGIQGVLYEGAKWNASPYVRALTSKLNSYDGYLVGSLVAQMLAKSGSVEQRFASGYASLYFVPYVYWVLQHALAQGTACLYFISRDGYHLKRIADAIIEAQDLPLKTQYIYGSRKVWRVPSQVDEIDSSFFSSYGNFTGVTDFDSLVTASAIGEERFLELFPELAFLKEQGSISKPERDMVVERLRDSEAYRKALLEVASAKRDIVVDYLKQEINFDEPFAFVEFWGRGYTQECHTRLLREANRATDRSAYYYARSICPSDEHNIRYNFTSYTKKMLVIERLFANMPYKTIGRYMRTPNGIIPVVEGNEYLESVMRAFNECLPEFARAFASLPFLDADRTMRELFAFSMDYFYAHKTEDVFLKCVAPLKDSITIQGVPTEFAPPLTPQRAIDRLRGRQVDTNSMRMTIARTNRLLEKLLKRFDR